MHLTFGFFLRLFISFVAAKLLLRAMDKESLGYLILLTIVFLVNLYWFEFPDKGTRLFGRGRPRANDSSTAPSSQEGKDS